MPTSRKSKQFSVGVYNNKHLRNLSARLRKVQTLIDEAANKATRIAVRTGYKDTSKDFQFDDFPQARREIDALIGELSTNLSVNVREASSEAWGTANAKNDAMVDYMLSSAGSKLGKRATQKWYNKNARALNAFLHRREEGMGLSSNVWRLDEFKTELELALELGLGRGKSAAELSRDVRSYLKHPDKLFRRVRDEKGVLRLSRAAEAFHPGQGVYRSSYKNALRLTATETNMAYRTADSKRWQQIDFVIGITIKVSQTNHTVVDICDELQGDYPKDFVFTGWHPFCKCYATSKLASPEEFLKYQQAILDGEDVSDWKFSGEVKDVPGNFDKWAWENRMRVEDAKTLPYFIRDNKEYYEAAIKRQEKAPERFVMTDEEYKKLSKKIRFEGVDSAEEYNKCAMAGFDVNSVLDDISNEFKKYGINDFDEITIIREFEGCYSFNILKGKPYDPDIQINRIFTRSKGGITVEHESFVLADRLENKGISRVVLKTYYEQYKKIGVSSMILHANLDVGGYCWGRYGFCNTKGMEGVKNVIGHSDAAQSIKAEATKVIEEYYKDKDKKTPFPMNILSDKPYGKELLLNTDWYGVLNLNNKTARERFEWYLGR